MTAADAAAGRSVLGAVRCNRDRLPLTPCVQAGLIVAADDREGPIAEEDAQRWLARVDDLQDCPAGGGRVAIRRFLRFANAARAARARR